MNPAGQFILHPSAFILLRIRSGLKRVRLLCSAGIAHVVVLQVLLRRHLCHALHAVVLSRTLFEVPRRRLVVHRRVVAQAWALRGAAPARSLCAEGSWLARRARAAILACHPERSEGSK